MELGGYGLEEARSSVGLGKAFDGAERVSEGAGRASDRAGRVSRGAGRLSDRAGMSSEEARRASQGAIVALLRALGEGNREKKKNKKQIVFSCGSSRGHCPKTMTR